MHNVRRKVSFRFDRGKAGLDGWGWRVGERAKAGDRSRVVADKRVPHFDQPGMLLHLPPQSRPLSCWWIQTCQSMESSRRCLQH